MSMTRRTLLVGGGAGVLTVLLASCLPEPEPSPTATRTPTPTPRPTTAPAAAVRSSWATDPFARGAASYTPVGTQAAARSALGQPVGDRVFFAGEATSEESPGTMRGAERSGRRAALDLTRRITAEERVAVIGAGLAGAHAAAALAAQGIAVTVIEARDRSGGRIHSLLDDDWPLPPQLGGWLLTPRDTQLRAQLAAAGITTADLDTERWLSPAGPVEAPEDEVLTAAVKRAQAGPVDVSLAQALIDAGADPEDPSTAALLGYLTAMTGADADALSAWFPPPPPADQYAAATGDLSPLVDRLLDGLEVRYSSPVSRIVYDDAGVGVRLGTGESLSFDRVVVTVPLGVLQSDGIEFDPVLPFSTRGAIADLAMGQIETVWLRFDAPFWETDAVIWHLVDGDAHVRTWFNLLAVTGESILVGLVGGAAAEEFALLDDADALAAATSSLELLLAVGQSEP